MRRFELRTYIQGRYRSILLYITHIQITHLLNLILQKIHKTDFQCLKLIWGQGVLRWLQPYPKLQKNLIMRSTMVCGCMTCKT